MHSSHPTINRIASTLRQSAQVRAAEPGHKDEDTLSVQDSAFGLVRCDKHVFLAVIQVLGIRRDGKDVQPISSHLLVELSARVNGRIMKLSPIIIDSADAHLLAPESADCEWNGNLETGAGLRDLYGRHISQADPQLQRASQGRNMGEDTCVFKTSELISIAAVTFSSQCQYIGFISVPCSKW